jgi:hypothetical protein
MSFYSFIVFSLIIIAAGIYGGMSIPTLIGILVICFFGWWRTSIRKNSGIDKIYKPIPEDIQKSKSVVITSDGEVIRTLEDGSVKSNSDLEKTNLGKDNIMWDFKLKKTRIILVISILWVLIIYSGCSTDVWSSSFYFDETEWLLFFLWGIPVWIYWVVIPSYRWVMKGK